MPRTFLADILLISLLKVTVAIFFLSSARAHLSESSPLWCSPFGVSTDTSPEYAVEGASTNPHWDLYA